MKKHICALLCALLLLGGTVPAASALEGESLRAADTLAALGIVRGDYALDTPATYTHAAVLLVRLAGAEPAEPAPGTDAPAGTPDWARPSVACAISRGWVDAGDFRPGEAVTATAWCSMLLRMVGYSDKNGDFSIAGAPVFAQHIGLISQSCVGLLTRGQLFQQLRDALTFPLRDGSGTVAEHLVRSGACTQATAGALGLLSRELTARQAADRHMAAVFALWAYDTEEDLRKGDPSGSASGFFISSDGLAVTNYHSIQGASHATVTLSSGECYPVESVVYYAPKLDLAVLRVSRADVDGHVVPAFSCLELAGTPDVRAGDTVYALGNPLGLGLSVSSGVVSAPSREVSGYALPCVVNTADISKGSSGGALLNVYGHVIGVTSGAFANGNGMYLAVPVDPLMVLNFSDPGMSLAEVARLERSKN